ncbi:MAG: hypothetical protein A2173_04090 [Planctomycetes bacterium RBG_13_44_8b]|nr:MAG: hypothetical protein A2173_04090 [Planctomycetes bacterium RBG_13_44_8b]
MANETNENNNSSIQELSVHMEEYKTLRDEILKRIEFQHNFLNYYLIALGIVASAGATIAVTFNDDNISKIMPWFLLGSPWVFFFFSWSFSNEDIMIVCSARYINQVLRPKITAILKGRKILEFEDFLYQERNIRRNFLIVPIFVGEYILLPPIVLIVIYSAYYLTSTCGNDWGKVLFVVDIFAVLITIVLRIIAGINYNRILREQKVKE